MNCNPLSEIIPFSTLKSLNTILTIISANLENNIILLTTIYQTSFINLLTITRIELYIYFSYFKKNKSIIKSIVIFFQNPFKIGRVYNLPYNLCLLIAIH